MNAVVGRHVVHFIERLQPDAIELGYRIHALAGTYRVRMVLILLFSVLALLFQIDDVACFKPVSLVSLVDAGQLSVRYAELFAYALEGISGPGFQIIVLIIYMYRVQRSATYGWPVVAVVLAHEVVVALGAVVSVELIQLYDVYKLLGISRVGGISCAL